MFSTVAPKNCHTFTTQSPITKISTFNYLPNNKILDWSKLKAFADDKINVNEKLKFGIDRVENIAGKGEHAGY